jgi:hypothetical protein
MNDQQFNAILEALDNIAHMNADDSGGRAMLYKNGELEDGIPTDTDALLCIRDQLVQMNSTLERIAKQLERR